MLNKFRESGVAKKAAELMVPMLSNNNSPRSARSGAGADGAAMAPASPNPQMLSPFHSSTTEGTSSFSQGCDAHTSCSTPVSGTAEQQRQEQEQGQQQTQQTQQAQQQMGSYGSFSAAKKTLGKLFGAGGNSGAWSGDGQAPASPNGGGLIAAFRSIIPKTSSGSPAGARLGQKGRKKGRKGSGKNDVGRMLSSASAAVCLVARTATLFPPWSPS
jgi:hypothetical protein